MSDLWDDGWAVGNYEGRTTERERTIAILREEGLAAPAGWTLTDWIISLIQDEAIVNPDEVKHRGADPETGDCPCEECEDHDSNPDCEICSKNRGF